MDTLSTAVSAMFSLRPALKSELTAAAINISENLLHVVDACVEAAAAARRDPEMMHSVMDGIAYAKDACLSICALLRVYSPAALMLLLRGAQLIEALGAVHDHLLPRVDSLAASTRNEVGVQLRKRCAQVEVSSEAAVVMLLRNAFLDSAAASAGGSGSSSSSSDAGGSGSSSSSSGAGGSGSSGAGSSSSGAGGSGSGSNSNSNSSSNKMQRTTADPSATRRGEALLDAMTQLGHREGSNTTTTGAAADLSLSGALAHRHGLGGLIQLAIQSGFVALDEVQSDYVAALLDVSSLGAAPTTVVTGTVSGASINDGDNGNDDVAMMLSLVSQVRDLLPDFGEGFVAACLDGVDKNPERAINVLLEGALPVEIEKMDVHMTFQQYQEMKTKKFEAAAAGAPSSGGGGGGGVQLQAPVVNQKRPGGLTAKYLDIKEASYANKTRTMAIESQVR